MCGLSIIMVPIWHCKKEIRTLPCPSLNFSTLCSTLNVDINLKTQQSDGSSLTEKTVKPGGKAAREEQDPSGPGWETGLLRDH